MPSSVASATDTYAERVGERGDSLAPAERRVAQLLLELGPEATLLSAAALAEQLGTSDATVVRTAKSLGYAGLAELRRALAAYGDIPPLGERLRRTLDQAPAEQLFATAIRQSSPMMKSYQNLPNCASLLMKSPPRAAVVRGVDTRRVRTR